MCLIETPQGLENVEAIIAEGIDVLMLGRGDLSVKMGLGYATNHSSVLAAARDFVRSVADAGAVGFQPKGAYEANDYQEVQAMVAVGVGVSLVPRLALTVLRNDVRVIPLSGEVPRRPILLARVKDSHPTGAEIAMTAMLVEAAGDLTLVSHR